MTKKFLILSLMFVLIIGAVRLHADNLPQFEGAKLYQAGDFAAAAKWCASYLKENAPGIDRAAVLILLGNSLEKVTDSFNTDAEKECFRSGSKKDGTACMQAYAEKLNSMYGASSFEYSEGAIYIRYTGAQYKEAIEKYPSSPYSAQAAYMELTKNLIGAPEVVLPRIKEFMAKYNAGEWGRQGRLLWARVNEDIWWIHRKWSWVLYNWKISPEDLIVKAEPYRQEALRTFEDIIKKDGSTEEGKAAKKEYELLKNYKDDGKLYGIVNESTVQGALVR